MYAYLYVYAIGLKLYTSIELLFFNIFLNLNQNFVSDFMFL